MTAKPKHYFAAMPARALADRRLDSNRRRDTLGIIALHDRMSTTNKGQGCRASATRLARMIGTSKGRFTSNTADLILWGYVTSEPQPDSRKRILRVAYDDEADLAALTADYGETESDSARSPNRPPEGQKSDSTAPGIGLRAESQKKDSYGVEEILRSASAPAGSPPASPPSPEPVVDNLSRKNSAEAGSAFTEPDGVDLLDDRLATDGSHNQDARALRQIKAFLAAPAERPFTASEIETLQRWEDLVEEIRSRWFIDNPGLCGLAMEVAGQLDSALRPEPEPEPEPLRCSFCGRSQHEVATLLKGEAGRICADCVHIARDVIAGAS